MDTTQSAVETLLFRSRRALAEAYQRLEAATTERCGQARKTMAALLDGEATPVQRRAIEAHADQCRVCRVQFGQMGRASAAYGLLPLLPVPALLGQRVLAGLGASSSAVGAAGGGGTLSKLLTFGLTKVQLATAALTITGGLAVGAAVSPSDSPRVTFITAAVPAASAGSAPAGAGPAQAAQPATALGLTGRVPALAEATALLDRIVAHAVELSARPVVVPVPTLPAALPAVPGPAVALPTLPAAPTAPVALPKLPLPQPTALPGLPLVP